RTGEQIDAVAKSKAWAKLKAMPSIKQLLQMADAFVKQQNNPQVAALLELYKQPENQQLVALLRDMVSQEIFCYGGESCIGFVELAGQLQNASRFGPLAALPLGGNPTHAQLKAVLQVVSKNPDLVKLPDFVIGFKLSKAEAAEAQLKRLE